jgi:hypothetical protein
MMKIRLYLKNKQGNQSASLEHIMQAYLNPTSLMVGENQKLINIRSLKVFLMVEGARGLSAYDVENLVDYLDKDRNGWVGITDLDRELGFSTSGTK